MQYIIFYLIVINLLTYVFFGIDKVKAQKSSWRIPEKTLFTLSFLGGSVGALLAMNKFRHKTKKSEFKNVIYLIVLVQLSLLVFIGWQVYVKA